MDMDDPNTDPYSSVGDGTFPDLLDLVDTGLLDGPGLGSGIGSEPGFPSRSSSISRFNPVPISRFIPVLVWFDPVCRFYLILWFVLDIRIVAVPVYRLQTSD